MRSSAPELTRKNTVYVLGAGFTRAFCTAAPLLISQFPVRERLLPKYRKFPKAFEILKDACLPNDMVNIERLLTRLSERMPYDGETDAVGLSAAYADVVLILQETITQALRTGIKAEPLLRFAEHYLENQGFLITFNYDDLLDRAFSAYGFQKNRSDRWPWNPTWGYGFCARGADAAVTGSPLDANRLLTRHIYKLHGSLNWKIMKGAPKPRQLNSIVTHQEWHFENGSEDQMLEDRITHQLEDVPFIVPPVLSKSSLLNEPVIRVVWEHAYQALLQASNIVFIGYSLPVTDLAARFLFTEATRGLNQSGVTVIDYFDPNDRTSDAFIAHRDQTLQSYRSIFPKLKASRLSFEGAEAWAHSLVLKPRG